MVMGAESSRGGLRRSVYSVWFAGEPGLWEVGWWGEQCLVYLGRAKGVGRSGRRVCWDAGRQ